MSVLHISNLSCRFVFKLIRSSPKHKTGKTKIVDFLVKLSEVLVEKAGIFIRSTRFRPPDPQQSMLATKTCKEFLI